MILGCHSGEALAASASLELEQTQLTVGDSTTLTLRIEGANVRGGHPRIPTPAGLRIAPSGQSTQVSIVNGRQSMQLALTYTLEAARAGDYTLASMEVPTDSGSLKTRPVALKVTAAAAVNLGNGPAFLKLAPGKTNLYFGEVLLVDLQLFAEEGRLLQDPQMVGEGFNFSKIAPPAQTRRTVNGRTMNLVTFRVAAFPVKTGPLSLGPVSLQLEVPRPGSRPDFFGFRASQNLRVVAEEVVVQVLPLPPGAPSDFAGAVGRFEMTYSAGPRALGVGDPITLKIAITGNGMMDGLRLPDLSHWTGFRFYPPSARSEMADVLEVSGTRYFEQVVVPQNPEIKALPEFRWSFFDPEERAYRTLLGASMPIQLTASAVPNAPLPSLGTNGASAQGGTGASGLLHIRPFLGTLTLPSSPIWRSPMFLLLQLVPFAVWAWLRGVRYRRESLDKNPRLRRRLEAEREVAQGLKDLRPLADAGKGADFFARLTRTLRCQIGERLNIPDSGITEEVVQSKLVPLGLSASDAEALTDLFHQSNQFSYASQLPPAGLATLIPKAEAIIQALRNLPDDV